MNFFRKLFGFIAPFFIQAAKSTLGRAAAEISDTAMEVVTAIENEGGAKGKEKKDIAFNRLQEKYPDVKIAAINFAIETAVVIIKDLMGENR